MSKELEARSGLFVRLPAHVMEALESDAVRCRRSKTAQVEAILAEYYCVDSVELDREIDPIRHKISPDYAGRVARTHTSAVQDHSINQGHLFSEGVTSGKRTRKRARDLKKDIEDARKDARERGKKRAAGQ